MADFFAIASSVDEWEPFEVNGRTLQFSTVLDAVEYGSNREVKVKLRITRHGIRRLQGLLDAAERQEPA